MDKRYEKAGVYAFKIRNYCYVGKASYLNTRKSTHIGALKNGTHHNAFFQNVYDKYGDELSYSVLCYADERLDYHEARAFELCRLAGFTMLNCGSVLGEGFDKKLVVDKYAAEYEPDVCSLPLWWLRQRVLVKEYAAGVSLYELRKKWNYGSGTSLVRILAKHGVTRRDNDEVPEGFYRSKHDEERVISLYTTHGKTLYEIEDITGVPNSTVSDILRRNNVVSRGPGARKKLTDEMTAQLWSQYGSIGAISRATKLSHNCVSIAVRRIGVDATQVNIPKQLTAEQENYVRYAFERGLSHHSVSNKLSISKSRAKRLLNALSG